MKSSDIDNELLDQAVAFAEMWGTEQNWPHVRDAYVAAILRERKALALRSRPEDDLIAALKKRAEWHKCSCPEPCDDYGVFPGGCAGRYREDYLSLLALRSRPASALPVVGEAELLTRALAYLDDIYNPDDDALYTLRAAIRSALIPSVQP